MKQRKEVSRTPKTFIDFILDCETAHGGALFREYLATTNKDEMDKFFQGKNIRGDTYVIREPELSRLWEAKDKAEYISIDYEYINGAGKSY
jgi:hypothetical protein